MDDQLDAEVNIVEKQKMENDYERLLGMEWVEVVEVKMEGGL